MAQLLESNKDPKTYVTFTRWGRVGLDGQTLVVAEGGLDVCKRAFCSKFKDKTKNSWEDRANFVFVAGKYDLLQIDYSLNEAETAEYEEKLAEVGHENKARAARTASALPPAVQSLMELLFDAKAMSAAVVELQYDVKKLPLGKLTGGWRHTLTDGAVVVAVVFFLPHFRILQSRRSRPATRPSRASRRPSRPTCRPSRRPTISTRASRAAGLAGGGVGWRGAAAGRVGGGWLEQGAAAFAGRPGCLADRPWARGAGTCLG